MACARQPQEVHGSGPLARLVGLSDCEAAVMVKPRLLVVELWGLGDLIIATPFLRAAAQRFDVTLLAKPHAAQLRRHFWPEVTVIPMQAPWTAFRHKYRLWRWPWNIMGQIRHHLAEEAFAVAVSCRRDPRDHALMAAVGATDRMGFPRWGSQVFLNRPLPIPGPLAHRYDYWRAVAGELGLRLPEKSPFAVSREKPSKRVLLHSGAGQPIRSWPLERYHNLCKRLRAAGYEVKLACDPGQLSWWTSAGERNVATPESVDTLMSLIESSDYFVGNDSGPGHVAAACGLPTFTIFGPQLPEWFVPMSAKAEFVEGKPCPFRPCSDYCQFPVAYCLERITEEEVWERVANFLKRQQDDSA
jgi:ADP-heptose:LPS heptosyltransferase